MFVACYKCKLCNSVVSCDSNDSDKKRSDSFFITPNIDHCIVEETIVLSSEEPDTGCTYRIVKCNCGNMLGKYYLSATTEHMHLRDNYALYDSAVNVSTYRISKSMKKEDEKNGKNYIIGEDAIRAYDHVKKLREVEKAIIVNEKRIQKLEKLYRVYSLKQVTR